MFQAACDLFAPFPARDDDSQKDLSKSHRRGSSLKLSIPELPSIMGPEHDDEDEPLSPFVKYEADGFIFPDLYSEIDEMMECCVLLYPLVELRRLARQGRLPQEKIMLLPLQHAEVIQIVEKYKQKIMDDVDDLSLQALVVAKERGETHVTPTSIIAIDDEFEKEELVYAVHVCERRKRVTVCFRGSVTETDWATNFQIYFKEVPNPVKQHASQEETVCVHHGFHSYLFEPNARGVKGPNGELLSQYQEILQEHILPVLREHPNYKLYICGHSLGGALATLFAFEVSSLADHVIPKPVSLFSVGSPCVGNHSFRAAHQLLESQGKLRHLRISNHKDTVTIIPKISFRLNIFDRESHVGSLFKHVGINMKLYDGATPLEITYPAVRSGFFSSALGEMARGWEQSIFSNWSWNPVDHFTWPHHSLKEYSERIDLNKPTLQAMQLNKLYARKDIVGCLVADF